MIIHIKKSNGTVLILSLVLLIALTALGVAMLSSAAIEKKTGANFKDLDQAEQAAHSVLQEGKQWLDALIIEPTPTTTGILRANGSIPDALSDPTWWETNGISSSETYIAGANPAKYIIEALALDETTHEQSYRVIGIAYAQNNHIYKIAQQTYRIPFARIRYHGDSTTWIFQNDQLACSSENTWFTLNTCTLMNTTEQSKVIFYVRRSIDYPIYGLLATIQWQGKTYYSHETTFTPIANADTIENQDEFWDQNLVSDYLSEAKWLWGISDWFTSTWQPGTYYNPDEQDDDDDEKETDVITPPTDGGIIKVGAP